MTVADLDARMSASEFAEWKAYYEDEPFGFEIEEIRQGLIAYMVYTMAPGRKTRRKVADFTWSGNREKKHTDVKDIFGYLKRLTVAKGGTVNDQRKG